MQNLVLWALIHVLGQLPEIKDKNVLIDSKNSDDAGVYKITDDIAVVLTTDFFTPIVDDPTGSAQ